MTSHLSRLSICLLLLLLSSCGTNPKTSESPVGLKIDVSPFGIDSGDETLVTIYIDAIEVDDFVIKVRVPKALEYVTNSAVLRVEEDYFDPGPQKVSSSSTSYYILFYLSRWNFFEATEGEIRFALRGVSDLPAGVVEVDADLIDPESSNEREFDPKDPKFTAQDEDDVRVGPPPPEETETTKS